MAKRRPLRKNYKSRRGKRRPLRKRASSKLIRRIARQEVHRQIEDKEQRFNSSNVFYNLPGSSNFTNYNIYDCNYHIGQNITQGVGQGQRVGNRIRLRRYNLKYRFSVLLSYTAPVYLKMWVIVDKFNPNGMDVGAISTCCANGPWFNNGSGSTGMSQNTYDLMFPLDQDRFRLLKSRVWKLGLATSPQGTVTGLGNNDFKLVGSLNLNLTKYMPKLIRFRDTETYIYSRNTFIVFQCVNALGDIPPTNVGMISWFRTVEIKFEDA